LTAQGQNMKVKFVKFPIALRLSYNVGDVADLEQKQAELLISEGYAEEVKVEKKKKPINPEEGD
jgi:hypothetical protein